jgi:hypothetical protein
LSAGEPDLGEAVRRMRWHRLMTRRRTCRAIAVLIVVGAMAVYVSMLPDEYGCDATPIPGITALDGRNFTCVEATGVIQALFRGEGHPIPGSHAVTVRKWRCLKRAGLIRCTRGRHHWLRANYTLRR